LGGAPYIYIQVGKPDSPVAASIRNIESVCGLTARRWSYWWPFGVCSIVLETGSRRESHRSTLARSQATLLDTGHCTRNTVMIRRPGWHTFLLGSRHPLHMSVLYRRTLTSTAAWKTLETSCRQTVNDSCIEPNHMSILDSHARNTDLCSMIVPLPNPPVCMLWPSPLPEGDNAVGPGCPPTNDSYHRTQHLFKKQSERNPTGNLVWTNGR
jgi:hypothetical protein